MASLVADARDEATVRNWWLVRGIDDRPVDVAERLAGQVPARDLAAINRTSRAAMNEYVVKNGAGVTVDGPWPGIDAHGTVITFRNECAPVVHADWRTAAWEHFEAAVAYMPDLTDLLCAPRLRRVDVAQSWWAEDFDFAAAGYLDSREWIALGDEHGEATGEYMRRPPEGSWVHLDGGQLDLTVVRWRLTWGAVWRTAIRRGGGVDSPASCARGGTRHPTCSAKARRSFLPSRCEPRTRGRSRRPARDPTRRSTITGNDRRRTRRQTRAHRPDPRRARRSARTRERDLRSHRHRELLVRGLPWGSPARAPT